MTDRATQLREALEHAVIYDRRDNLSVEAGRSRRTSKAIREAARIIALPILEGGFWITRSTGEPYEIGWCIEHRSVAFRYKDSSWHCLWQAIVEASGDHRASDFQPLGAALLGDSE